MLGTLGRNAERRHRIDPLPVYLERFPTCRNQMRCGIGEQQTLGHLGCRVNDMLAVVQHQ